MKQTHNYTADVYYNVLFTRYISPKITHRRLYLISRESGNPDPWQDILNPTEYARGGFCLLTHLIPKEYIFY